VEIDSNELRKPPWEREGEEEHKQATKDVYINYTSIQDH
jgi:hypothetical protein